MPWQERDTMELRVEFVLAARQDGVNVRELCRRYQVSPTTGYTWLARFEAEGMAGLVDQSRRPHHSPQRTPDELVAQVLALRDQHPSWGGRKLRAWLVRQAAGDPVHVPSASTITAILQRHGRIAAGAPEARPATTRFEAAAPNDLWQIDFMGHLALEQGRVHPLCVLDDHSRFVLGVFACANEQRQSVHPRLRGVFARYGLPWRILTDNGPPWGDTGSGGVSRLEVWWRRLGIAVCHGRPRHPQTQGKVERVHRTLAADLLQPYRFRDLASCQQALDQWRQDYNGQRPHQALDDAVPASRYQPSRRPLPETLPAVVYRPDDVVRRVMRPGYISYGAQRYWIGRAYEGEAVALRPTTQAHILDVYFIQQHIRTIDLRTPRGAAD